MFVNFNILNQLGSPAINSNTFANRPAAGQTGRLFVSTDTFEIYRDNGTTWDLIGGPGTSTITGSGTATQVAYFTSSQAIGSSANLYWDNTAGALGINTNAPTAELDVHGVGVMLQLNETTGTSNSLLAFQRSGVGVWRIGDVYNGGSNYFEIYNTVLGTTGLQLDGATNKAVWQSQQTYSTGLARANYFDYNLSVPAATSFTSPNAITALGASLDLTLAGNATIPSGARTGLDAYNSVSFTGAGTLTMTQGTQIRPYSNVTAGWAFAGSAAGTITHLAGLRVLFPDNSGSAVTITNNYGLLINDQTANTGTVTYTNRWGIYQEGASDLNYFAANTLIGTTTNAGYKFDVSGSGRFTDNGYFATSSGSNVIIGGTNIAAWDTNQKALQIGNTSSFYNASNGTFVGNNTYNAGLSVATYLTNGFASAYGQTNQGTHNFYTAPSGIANNPITFTVSMRLFADGTFVVGPLNAYSITNFTSSTTTQTLTNLHRGIQTNDPTLPTTFGYPYLQIGGQENLVNSIQTIGFGFTNGSTFLQPVEIGYVCTSVSGYTIGDFVIATRNSTGNVAPTERVRVKDNGNFLIGTTTDTGQKLQVNGTSYLSSTVGINTTSPNSSAILDIVSTTQGVAIPRMTSTERSAISTPTTGLAVYNTTNKSIDTFDTTWLSLLTNINSIKGFQALGSEIKTLGVAQYSFTGTTNSNLVSQQAQFVAVYLANKSTLTGVGWVSNIAGIYTGNNYNGVGLYTYSGGTLTLVASSTNDANCFASAGFNKKAFSATYDAEPGLYFVCWLYCSSAQTTAPPIRTQTCLLAENSLDFTNTAKLNFTLAGQTALPSSLSISSGTTVTNNFLVALY